MSPDNAFLHTELFGDLAIFDVLTSYEHPRVFVCTDEFNAKYLFFEIEEEESFFKWVVSKLRNIDYFAIIDRKKTIQSIFKSEPKSEKYTIKYEPLANSVASVSFASLDDLAKVPTKDVFSEKNTSNDSSSNTLKAARDSGFTVLDIGFFKGSNRHTMDSSTLGELCTTLSQLVQSLKGQKRVNKPQVQTVEGSCIVRFSFPEEINLFDDNLAKDEIGLLTDILDSPSISSSVERVSDKKQFFAVYPKFLSTIKKANSNVVFSSASPNDTIVKEVNITQSTIKNKSKEFRAIFEEKHTELLKEGTLIALDIPASKFKILTSTGSIIAGNVNQKKIEDKKYVIPNEYSFCIEEISKFDDKNYVEKKTYTLHRITDSIDIQERLF